MRAGLEELAGETHAARPVTFHMTHVTELTHFLQRRGEDERSVVCG
jgi:hypothetical protein